MANNNYILWGIAGLAAYFWLTRSNINPQTYPPVRSWPNSPVTPQRQPTGSGGVTAGSGGSNPLPGGNIPTGGNVPTGSGGVVATGYVTCDDGTLVNDPSLCPSGIGYYNCDDGTMVNDLSLCPESQLSTVVDTMDPCDPTSSAYDPNACGVAVAGTSGDWWGSFLDGGTSGVDTGTADMLSY